MADQSTITHNQLRAILAELGYTREEARSTETYTVYNHPGRPVSIILPILPGQSAVHPMHLAMVRRILAEQNEDAVRDFERLVADPRNLPVP